MVLLIFGVYKDAPHEVTVLLIAAPLPPSVSKTAAAFFDGMRQNVLQYRHDIQ